MNTNSAQEQPEERLRQFIHAMEKWETESWQAMRKAERTSTPDSYEMPARQQLNAIFQEFCTAKKRTYGREDDLSLANPSDYCSKKLVLTARKTSARRIEFVASSAQRGLVTKWVFVLLKVDGHWFVDNKKAINEDGSEIKWWL